MEETGLVVKSIHSLGYMTPDSGVVAARVHLYLADDCTQTPNAEGELGIKGLTFFPVSEFESMLMASEIQDSFTMSAWCRYRMMKALNA